MFGYRTTIIATHIKWNGSELTWEMQILYAWPPLYYNPYSAQCTRDEIPAALHACWLVGFQGMGQPCIWGCCVQRSPCRICCCCCCWTKHSHRWAVSAAVSRVCTHYFMFMLNSDRNSICRNYLESKTLKVCIQSCVYSLFFVGMAIILHQLQRRNRRIYDFWRFTVASNRIPGGRKLFCC